LSAPSLQSSPVEEPAAVDRGMRLSTAAAGLTGRAALSALSAAELAVPPAPVIPPELDNFIDELAAIVHAPITVYQRELLQQALVGAIDARFAALLERCVL